MSGATCTAVSLCKSCGARVRWAVSPAGKWMPVDAEPDMRPTGGNLVLTIRQQQLVFEPWAKEHGFTRNRYVSHFATCPAADKHRRTA